MPTNGWSSSSASKLQAKGPPPPVAPKPSWTRPANPVPTPNPIQQSSTLNQVNDENKLYNEAPPIPERHPSQKFNRSSSMNQISTNITQQQDIIPTRNKSLSIPDSR